jgi:hypothetical protein
VTYPWEEILENLQPIIETENPAGPKRIIYTDGGEERVSTQDLLTWVLRVPPNQQTTSHGQRLSVIMERLGWKRPRSTIRIERKPVRGFYRTVSLDSTETG